MKRYSVLALALALCASLLVGCGCSGDVAVTTDPTTAATTAPTTEATTETTTQPSTASTTAPTEATGMMDGIYDDMIDGDRNDATAGSDGMVDGNDQARSRRVR